LVLVWTRQRTSSSTRPINETKKKSRNTTWSLVSLIFRGFWGRADSLRGVDWSITRSSDLSSPRTWSRGLRSRVGRAELGGVLDGAVVVGVGGGDDPRGEPYDEAALVGDHCSQPRAHADAGPGRQPPRGVHGLGVARRHERRRELLPGGGADVGRAIFLGLPHEEGYGGGIASPLYLLLLQFGRTEGI
jgi:hypothetical protein